MGFILGLTPADIQDRDGARLLLWSALSVAFGWIKLIWADGGHSGHMTDEVVAIPHHRKVNIEIIKRSDNTKSFKVLPKRWIVERTFGWLIQSRRLVRDYEVNISHSESMIYPSITKRMLVAKSP
jgi:transposase